MQLTVEEKRTKIKEAWLKLEEHATVMKDMREDRKKEFAGEKNERNERCVALDNK